MDDIANSGFDPNAKPCAEALQSAQKRVRMAFFLNMAASCIVLLIAINLWNSLLVHNKLLDSPLSDKFEYLKEYSKQVADQSFYQIPSLGIQISCDDIGLLGPLTLLAFSLYSLMTLRASHCHIRCAASDRFSENPLIHALLETEKLPDRQSLPARILFSLPRWSLLIVPFGVCVAVFFYGRYAHFNYDLSKDLLGDIFSVTRRTAQWLDRIGWFIALLVGLCNYESFRISKDKEKDAHGIKQDPPQPGTAIPKTGSSYKAVAGDA